MKTVAYYTGAGCEELIEDFEVLYKDNQSQIEAVNHRIAVYSDFTGQFVPMSYNIGKYVAERFKRSIKEGCARIDMFLKIQNEK